MPIREEILISREQVAEPGLRHWGRFDISWETLSGGLSAGVQRIRVESDLLDVSILPTRGMGIESVMFGNIRFGWVSPVPGPVHPAYVPISEPSGLGWLDGFDELLVRCGITSNGAPEHDDHGRLVYPLHGRVANLSATDVYIRQTADDELEIGGAVFESRFHFDKWRLATTYRFWADQSSIDILDRVENLSGTARDFQMLYHYNLGTPLLEAGGKVHIPLERIVPKNAHSSTQLSNWAEIGEPQPGASEQVFFCQPRSDASGRCLAVLQDANGTTASAIEFSVAELPWFSIWKNFVAENDGYVIGLEPATNFPNPKSFERKHGRTAMLQPGASREFNLRLHFAADEMATRSLIETCRKIQNGVQPKISKQADNKWCPG